MSQPLKKQQIIGLFGEKAGTKLIQWLDPCCEQFCLDVRACGGGGFSLPITTNLQGGYVATYDQSNLFLGLPVSGAGQSFKTASPGINVLANLDTTPFGGGPDTTYVGYTTLGGGAEAVAQMNYNSSIGEANVLLSTKNSPKSAEIVLKTNPVGSSLKFNFNSGNYYFPTTSPSAGEVLGYTGPNQLGWVIPGGGSTTPGGANTYVQYNDSGAFGGDSNFVWNKTSKVFSVGDISNTSNRMKFIVNDSTFQTTAVLGFGGNFNIQDSTGAISFLTLYGQSVSLGDISIIGNKTILQLIDSSKRISAQTDGTFEVKDVVGRQSFLADMSSGPGNFVVDLGDISGGGFSTIFQVNDGSKEITAQTSNLFKVVDANNHKWFEVDNNVSKTRIGDIANVGNSTLFTVDDASRVMTATADLHFIVQKVNGDDWLDVSTTSNKVSMGDLAGTANGTKFVVDDGNQLIQSYSSNVNKNVLAGRAKVLTNNTVTSVFEVALPAGGMTGGFFTVTITATDGTDFQAHADHVTYAAVNKGGVYTTAIQPSNGDDAVATSAGTLAVTWSMITGTDKVIIQVNANSSLTTTSVKIESLNIDNHSGQVVTIL